jgi:hypothetical protein
MTNNKQQTAVLTHMCSGFTPAFQPSPVVGNMYTVPCKTCGKHFWEHTLITRKR